MIAGDNDTDDKFFNDTAEKVFSGVNDTADTVDTGDKRDLPILACLHLKIKNKQKFYFKM
jgi:hypothetical protein